MTPHKEKTAVPLGVRTVLKVAIADPQVVVIGLSTGGPAALIEVVPRLPGDFPLPVLIVQHMPPSFTRSLADRLKARSRLKVIEAVDGQDVRKGCVLVAPGDYHMRVRREEKKVIVRLDQGPYENSCRPSVDGLFRSAAEVYGGRVLAIVLTGMGQDGLLGVKDLKAKGAHVLAQSEASSVVWGMPGAVVQAGLADAVLNLDEIAPAILRKVMRR